MQEALLITTAIAVILFVGIICSWIGNRLKIPDVLLLILAGMLFGSMQFKGLPLIDLPNIFLASLGILALAMIVFDSTARLRLKELDTFSIKAVKLTLIWTLLILVLFSAAAHFVLKIPLWTSVLFASVMTGTSTDALLALTQKTRSMILLKLESIFNTPFTVILPFIVIDLMQNLTTSIFSDLIEQLIPFVMNFIVGIGTGVFVGLVLFKVVQKAYAEIYSPLAVIIAALFSYVLAENLGGSGVLAVTALGLFFGNVYVKEKPTLLEVESVLTKALYIFVFFSIGLIIKIPYTTQFFITSGILFAIFILIRALAVWMSVIKDGYTAGEKMFMTLNMPKGIATAAVVFILAVYQIEGITTILDMIFAFILYSIILSSLVTWGSGIFLHEKRTR